MEQAAGRVGWLDLAWCSNSGLCFEQARSFYSSVWIGQGMVLNPAQSGGAVVSRQAEQRSLLHLTERKRVIPVHIIQLLLSWRQRLASPKRHTVVGLQDEQSNRVHDMSF